MNIKDQLKKLHESLIMGLIATLEDPERASAADRKLAWEILKDNNVPLEDLRTECVARLQPLVNRLPFTDQSDEAEAA